MHALNESHSITDELLQSTLKVSCIKMNWSLLYPVRACMSTSAQSGRLGPTPKWMRRKWSLLGLQYPHALSVSWRESSRAMLQQRSWERWRYVCMCACKVWVLSPLSHSIGPSPHFCHSFCAVLTIHWRCMWAGHRRGPMPHMLDQ